MTSLSGNEKADAPSHAPALLPLTISIRQGREVPL